MVRICDDISGSEYDLLDVHSLSILLKVVRINIKQKINN